MGPGAVADCAKDRGATGHPAAYTGLVTGPKVQVPAGFRRHLDAGSASVIGGITTIATSPSGAKGGEVECLRWGRLGDNKMPLHKMSEIA